MLAPDRGTRSLLPLLTEKQDGIVQAVDDDAGQVRPIADLGPSPSHSSNPAIDPALPRVEPAHEGFSPSPATGTSSTAQNPASHASSSSADAYPAGLMAGGGGTTIEVDDSVSWSGLSPASGSPSGVSHATGTIPGSAAPHLPDAPTVDDDQQDPVHVTEDSIANTPPSDVLPGSGTPPATIIPSEAPAPAGIPIAVPDSDDIHIVQTAFVDQDADVLLNGWMGESKIRVFMDNDADMAQDADIRLDIDDNNRMFLRLDQSMTIDQNTEIDLDIYEVEGVLYVDLYLRNEVDIVQDTELDLMMDGWDGKSQFYVNNHLEVRQDVDVDVDIDDELEEKFAIKVAIGVKQAIDADQDADVDVNYADGGFGIDVDAVQTATIDQDTTLRIDFSVV
jgi:hypothetical protein